MSNHTEPHGTDITTEQMKANGTENATTTEESNEDIIKGRLGPHNTPMGTPSHSKGISFIDDEKEVGLTHTNIRNNFYVK